MPLSRPVSRQHRHFYFKSPAQVPHMRTYLDFEKPVAEMEAKVEELRVVGDSGDSVAISEEISRLEVKAALALKELYGTLTPWQKTQVARHPERPHCLDYVSKLVADFVPF